MKKILITTVDYEPAYAGIGVHTFHLANLLKKRGMQVTVIVARLKKREDFIPLQKNETYKLRTDENDIKIVEVNTDFKNLLNSQEQKIISKMNEKETYDYYCLLINQLFLKSVIDYLDSSHDSYDIIHMHDAFLSNGVVLLSHYLNIPLIITIHAINANETWLIDSLKRYTTFNVDKIICVSNYIRNEVIRRYNFLNNDKIITIHNSIFLDGNSILENKKEKRKNIVFCGRLVPVKGVDMLLYAYQKLPKKIKEKHNLIIIGMGSELKSLKTLCCKLEIESNVVFTGFIDQNEVMEQFKHSFCAVFPSKNEAFATTALEAMSVGCCVLASKVGGFIELIKDNKNGVLFDPNNINELFEKILHITNHEELAYSLGEKAHDMIYENYSWDNAITKICKVYDEVSK